MRTIGDAAAHGSTTSAHFFTYRSRPDPTKLAEILKRDSACRELDAIIVSGDVGWSGVDEDYELAARFFAAVRDTWPRAPIVLAPGNHDVDRDARSSDDQRQAAFIRFLKGQYGKSFKRRYPFVGRAEATGSNRQRLVSFEQLGNDALIVAVNSAASLTTKSTPVYVEPEVLELVEDYVASLEVPDQVLRVFVIHHHLFPFAEPSWDNVIDTAQVPDKPDNTIVANSAKLQAWLASNSFHLVLHGHKHMSHGRDDVLWREGDPQSGRRLLVVGAGSAGVASNERAHDEPLSYNVITTTRLGAKRWDVHIDVRRISDRQVVRAATNSYDYRVEIGQPGAGTPTTFSAECMDECHAAISASTRGFGEIRSFVSVVGDHTYVYPSTICLGDRTATDAEVRSSFRALHPEWSPESGWDDVERVAREVRNTPSRYQFTHGPRLFGVLGRSRVQLRGMESDSRLQPLRHAIETLRAGSKNRAYAGLYNAEVDLTSDNEPLPGLMSIQFVPDDRRYLDAVATFRKLELSFWWTVNMLEIGELLRWAAKQTKREARRITFFAALAEWKYDPEATFVTQLDQTPLNTLVDLVLRANSGRRGRDAQCHLAELLRDKIERTNDRNIDDAGLEKLVNVVEGVVQTRAGKGPAGSPISPAFHSALKHALGETVVALEHTDRRVHALDKVKEYLDAAVVQLERASSQSQDKV